MPLPFFTDNPRWVGLSQIHPFTSSFPHNTDSDNPRMTFSVSNLHLIDTATKVNIIPKAMVSATSTSGICESQTHLLILNHIASLKYTRNLICHQPGIECLLPWSGSAAEWQVRSMFSSLTTSLPHSCSHSLLIVFRSVLSTELLLSGSRISLPSFTCSGTFRTPWSPLFVLNDLFQLLQYMLGIWAHTLALLKSIVMSGFSQTYKKWNNYICIECNQFYSFHQNLLYNNHH